MRLAGPQDYKLKPTLDRTYKLSTASGVTRFTRPASTRGIAKLYTLSCEGKLVYVGVAQQPMSSRLNAGFAATGRGGYHGYKWRDVRRKLSLSIWTASTKKGHAPLRVMETIEAEVAFLCRKKSGQWPAFQHEIHFYASAPHHRQAAETIYRHAITVCN